MCSPAVPFFAHSSTQAHGEASAFAELYFFLFPSCLVGFDHGVIMPYSKPFGKIYLQFYSSIKSMIYDFAPKKELFYDPNLSVLVRVGELLCGRFLEEEYIYHRQFSI